MDAIFTSEVLINIGCEALCTGIVLLLYWLHIPQCFHRNMNVILFAEQRAFNMTRDEAEGATE